jgi:type I site-specific restriction-modification system R (restriction) subunit
MHYLRRIEGGDTLVASPATKEAQRAELHKTIWRIANDLRGSVDGWDFKSYVRGMLFYPFISENLTDYIDEGERKAGDEHFDFAKLSNRQAEQPRQEKDQGTEKESIIDDVVFEIELIKQVEINVDYILLLVQKYRDAKGDGQNKEIRAEITHAVGTSPSLRNKKDLVEDFVESISATGDLNEEWAAYVAKRRADELNAIIKDENLKPDDTHAFIETAFRDGEIKTTGTAITKVLPLVSRFAPDGGFGARGLSRR